jgi:serine/threonine-protein kinase
MAPFDADRNLLFGVLALQVDAISRAQFVDACSLWASQKDQSLADVLTERGWLAPEDRAEVDRLVERKLKRHGGDARAGLAEVTGDAVRRSLAGLDDPEIQRSLQPATEHEATGHVLLSTLAYQPETRERYTLTRLHARGGIGQVWLARDVDLGREVALKELRPERAGNPTVWARFLEEARITGQLEHPGIVPVYELRKRADDQAPFYTMRFVRGRTFSEATHAYHSRLAEGKVGPLELPELLTAFVGVCHAVAYAHSRGVIHRDLKGQNVVLGDYGEVMVLDWGLAKVIGRPEGAPAAPSILPGDEDSAGHDPTLQGQALGTPAYMAPEQASGRLDQIDQRTDVYGLGAILYEILAGRPPFPGEATHEILKRVCEDAPARPRSVCSAAPPPLEAVCLKALAKQPGDRYAAAQDLAREVQRFLADEPVVAYHEPLAKRAGRWARRHRPLVAGAAALLVTAVVALSISTVLINRERSRAEQSFHQARQAVDDYFTTVSESKLFDVPGMQPLRKELLDRALKYYQSFIQQRGGDHSVQSELAATYYRVAFITAIVGSADDALTAHRQSLALYESLVRSHPSNIRFQIDLAIVCNDLGNLQKGLGRADEALRTHQRGLALRDRLARAHPEGIRFQNELAKSYANIGSLLPILGRHDEALHYYEKARAINEVLVAARPAAIIEFPSDLGVHNNSLTDIQEDLARNYTAIGYLLSEMNRHEEASRSYGKAVAILEPLIALQPDVAGRQAILADAENRIGFHLKVERRYDEAMRHHQKARALFERLIARNPSVAGYRGGLVSCEHYIAGLLTDSGRPAEALPALRNAEAILKALVAEQPNVRWYRKSLALSSLYFGRLPAAVLSPAQALAALREGEALFVAAPDLIPVDLYNLACIRARIVPLLSQEPAERRRYEALALETLRQAVAKGYQNFANIRQDSDLEALRPLPAFHAVIAEAATTLASDRPPAAR